MSKGVSLSLSEGEHVSVAVADNQLAHIIGSVDRPLDNFDLFGAQLCGEFIDVGDVDVGIVRPAHDAPVGPRDRWPCWSHLPKKDANAITLDNGEGWRIAKELVEREAEKIAVELCCREDIVHQKIWGCALHLAAIGRFLLWHGQLLSDMIP